MDGNATITTRIFGLDSAPSRRSASRRPARRAAGLDGASREPRFGTHVMVGDESGRLPADAPMNAGKGSGWRGSRPRSADDRREALRRAKRFRTMSIGASTSGHWTGHVEHVDSIGPFPRTLQHALQLSLHGSLHDAWSNADPSSGHRTVADPDTENRGVNDPNTRTEPCSPRGTRVVHATVLLHHNQNRVLGRQKTPPT